MDLLSWVMGNGDYSASGIRCFEQDFKGSDDHPPVRLVVFDCDETLTVSTFLPKEQDLRTSIGWDSEHVDYIVDVNFIPPWNPKRLTQLKEMFAELVIDSAQPQDAQSSPKRALAVLTRNACGAVACLNLLKAAGLSEHLSAVWSMQRTGGPSVPHGVYKDGEGEWHIFSPPLQSLPDYKPEVLASIAREPEAWFPQGCHGFSELKLEEIVLVDDTKTNFESFSSKGPKVLRGVEVTNYDAEYLDMGYITEMGGIGAHHRTDFQELVQFVNEPWKFHMSSSKM